MVLFRVTLIEAGMIRITLAGIVVARRIAVERTLAQNLSVCLSKSSTPWTKLLSS
jgi:hypothetical protein